MVPATHKNKNVLFLSRECEALLQAILHTGSCPTVCDRYFVSTRMRDSLVVGVHSMNKFGLGQELIKTKKKNLIEDISTSIGAENKDGKAGALGDISICSFW